MRATSSVVVAAAPPPTTAPRTIAPPTTAAPAAPSSCNIKGNIAADGEKIYHLPGDRYYDRTEISPEKGERYFCTEADAVAAGWRHAKV